MKSVWGFKATGDGTDVLDLDVYDVIGADWWGDGVTAQNVRNLLQANKTAKTINMRINSAGGSVVDGMAIYNLLGSHPATVNATVDGLAASMASVLLMAADQRTIAKNAMVMIHNPSAIEMGDADAMRQMADLLDKWQGNIADIYAARTGQNRKDVISAMDAETWMTADEAKKCGYVDIITPAKQMAAAAWDLSGFRKAPDTLRALPPRSPEARPQGSAVTVYIAGGADPATAAEAIKGITAHFKETTPPAEPTAKAPVAEETPTMKTVLAILALAATATEDDAVRSIQTLKGDKEAATTRLGELESVTGKAGGEALGVITAWKEAAAQSGKIQDENKALKKAQADKELDDLIVKAKAEGRVVPAEEPHLRAMGLDVLKGYLPNKPVVVKLASAAGTSGVREVANDGSRGAAGTSVRHDGKAYEEFTFIALANMRRQAGGEEIYQELKASWEERGQPARKSPAAA